MILRHLTIKSMVPAWVVFKSYARSYKTSYLQQYYSCVHRDQIHAIDRFWPSSSSTHGSSWWAAACIVVMFEQLLQMLLWLYWLVLEVRPSAFEPLNEHPYHHDTSLIVQVFESDDESPECNGNNIRFVVHLETKAYKKWCLRKFSKNRLLQQWYWSSLIQSPL